ncbi:flavin reductase [Psychrobacter sp. AOP22-C1-22]|uniref:flavin reductase n=1 Tax=unclassified Psychrobacter TaxID=196806 RepID=UPI001787C65E|nr:MULTISPECIES: flavin reductase [unclassified Psychrobacter]MBE0406859.1 flavin reductase [Psychrobacter sp. FME6]MBE0445982.1 flavin reductase [Psychrobacter sp. FME5]MDN5801394.1 flavin reductase [Psychrobacter sp.]MDN5898102.1 flavin reductase [Psychrobacter sp.]
MIEATDFRDAMSLLTTAVNVITTKGSSGAHGFTASAVCSVTDTPPTLLVCMNQTSRSHAHFIDNKMLSVNVLGAQHEQISNAFASKLCSDERFEQGTWTELATGAPVLEDALVSFDCEIEDIQQVGTHSVFMCRVVAIKQAEQQGGTDESLVYFNRSYHQVGQVELV